MTKLSAAIATHNEEDNIGDCLKSIKDIVDQIVIVDGSSEDKTAEIAAKFRAEVVEVKNDPMFHKMKQKSFDLAKGEWVLYLDADERVSSKLGAEIIRVVNMTNEEIEQYQSNLKNKKMFLKHQKLLEERDGKIGESDGEYVAFFFPRRNFFLGKYLRYGGVYPDGVIRLFKKGKACLPCKDVHEQMTVLGKVGWLENDLLHVDSPNFKRYLERNNRYINLIAGQLKKEKVAKNFLQMIIFFIYKPVHWFLLTQIRHKGILDGWQGVVFSFFSALRFPKAYYRYLTDKI